jgi:hypothetical protein
MEDIVLRADLDETTSLYISPINRQTYEEQVQDDNLGGDNGYFVLRSRRTGSTRLEVLAKVPTLEAAIDLFTMIVGRPKHIAT